MATSLGLGVSQMAAGLNHLFGVDPGTTTQIILIGIISVVATFSAVSGVGNGIRIISEWNIWLSVVLLAFFLFGGPAKWLLGFFVTTVGDYLWNVVPMGFQTFNSEGDAAWQGGWTIFYWGWWISWAPFVGMFIARISRGRTIREFMVGVMFVPTTLAFFWLCIFGGNAIYAGDERCRRRGNGRNRATRQGLEPAGGALWHHRPGHWRRLAELGHGGLGHVPAGDLVHHVVGTRAPWSSPPCSAWAMTTHRRSSASSWGLGEGFVAAVSAVRRGVEGLADGLDRGGQCRSA